MLQALHACGLAAVGDMREQIQWRMLEDATSCRRAYERGSGPALVGHVAGGTLAHDVSPPAMLLGPDGQIEKDLNTSGPGDRQ
jgi:hypothetical protein